MLCSYLKIVIHVRKHKSLYYMLCNYLKIVIHVRKHKSLYYMLCNYLKFPEMWSIIFGKLASVPLAVSLILIFHIIFWNVFNILNFFYLKYFTM